MTHGIQLPLQSSFRDYNYVETALWTTDLLNEYINKGINLKAQQQNEAAAQTRL